MREIEKHRERKEGRESNNDIERRKREKGGEREKQ